MGIYRIRDRRSRTLAGRGKWGIVSEMTSFEDFLQRIKSALTVRRLPSAGTRRPREKLHRKHSPVLTLGGAASGTRIGPWDG